MLVAKKRDDSAQSKKLTSVLRSLIGKLDGVLIRALQPDEERGYNEFLKIHLGGLRIHEPKILNPWEKTNLRLGRFIFYKPRATYLNRTPQYELSICLSNTNPETNETIILTRASKNSQCFHEINQKTHTMTVTEEKGASYEEQKLLIPWTKRKQCDWNFRKIKIGTILIKKGGTIGTPILCTEVIPNSPNTIKYIYYEYSPIQIQLTEENSIITSVQKKRCIPYGLHYETPILFEDHSAAADTTIPQAPSTFAAVYQLEALEKSKSTSIKRYFYNAREILGSHPHQWRAFCGRAFLFKDEEEGPLEEDPIGDTVQGNSSSIKGHKSSASIGQKPESECSSESFDPELDDYIRGNTGYFNPHNHRPPAKEGADFTCTKKICYTAKSSSIFMNLFIIFQHWAQYDQHKDSADKALWDPDLDAPMFDHFYPATAPIFAHGNPVNLEETMLQPWMFSVTQALRDWIHDLVYSVTVSDNRERQRVSHVHDDVTGKTEIEILTENRDELIISTIEAEFVEMQSLFTGNGEVFTTVEGADAPNVTPISAAFNWHDTGSGEWKSLTIRAYGILNNAFKMAFPRTRLGRPLNPKEEIDFTKEDFIAYIKEQLVKIQTGIFTNIDTPLPIKSLQSIALKNLTGAYIPKESITFRVIQQHKHLPLLFPQLLKKGSVLAMYDSGGCTIVRFVGYSSDMKITYFEENNMDLQHFQYNREVYNREERKQFVPRLLTLYFSLINDNTKDHQNGDDIHGIENLINVFVLDTEPSPAPPEP